MSVEQRLTEAFPFLRVVSRASREIFLSRVATRTLGNGQILVRGGSTCTHLPLVMGGTVRVYKTSETGKELTLYRIERGESCILTATCILAGGTFPAVAAAEGDTEVALAPAELLGRLVEEHAEWRSFVFGLYARRLEHMMSLVEEVAFHRVDERVIAYLLRGLAPGGDTIRVTHERIATELGTSREVVTRILRDLEARRLVATGRGEIRILQREALARGTTAPM